MSIEHPPIPTEDRLPAWRRACLAYGEMRQAGANSDLPVFQPSRLELVLNLKAAKALGLSILPSILLRADEVIE
jgi:putative tryptophan/tyrosine transport system substrate-binding protein